MVGVDPTGKMCVCLCGCVRVVDTILSCSWHQTCRQVRHFCLWTTQRPQIALEQPRAHSLFVCVCVCDCVRMCFGQEHEDAPLARKQFLLHESEAAAMIAVSGAEILR